MNSDPLMDILESSKEMFDRRQSYLIMKPLGQSYEIRVESHLSGGWSEWFDNLEVRQEMIAEGCQPLTILVGFFPDQAALHGILQKIRDLNLILISVKRLEHR